MNALEIFMFISINPKNGGLFNSRTFIRYGLVGIAIAELFKLGKVNIDGKHLTINNTESTNHEILNDVLQVLSRKTTPQRLDSLVYSVAYKVRGIDRRVFEKLEDNGFLMINQKKFLGLFPYKRYTVTYEAERDKIIKGYKEIILNGDKSPDAESMLLISMTTVCEFSRRFFSKEEKRQAAGALKLIKKGKFFEPSDDVNARIIKAVQRAIVATQAAAHAAGS